MEVQGLRGCLLILRNERGVSCRPPEVKVLASSLDLSGSTELRGWGGAAPRCRPRAGSPGPRSVLCFARLPFSRPCGCREQARVGPSSVHAPDGVPWSLCFGCGLACTGHMERFLEACLPVFWSLFSSVRVMPGFSVALGDRNREVSIPPSRLCVVGCRQCYVESIACEPATGSVGQGDVHSSEQ